MRNNKEAAAWIKKAEKDLRTSKGNAGISEYEAAAFFAHQAAEKALKAVYILQNMRLWKIHDLQKLATAVDADEKIEKICGALNPHYIATRYPSGARYSRRIAERAIKHSKQVVSWAKEQIQKK